MLIRIRTGIMRALEFYSCLNVLLFRGFLLKQIKTQVIATQSTDVLPVNISFGRKQLKYSTKSCPYHLLRPTGENVSRKVPNNGLWKGNEKENVTYNCRVSFMGCTHMGFYNWLTDIICTFLSHT